MIQKSILDIIKFYRKSKKRDAQGNPLSENGTLANGKNKLVLLEMSSAKEKPK